MNRSYLSFPSVWGREVRHRYISNGSSSLVVIFPGKNYPCQLPLLYYASLSAIENNHDVLQLEYGYQSARTELEFDDLHVLVEECAQAIHEVMEKYEKLIFVSKSLGTIVAGQVAEAIEDKDIRHIYLTPVDRTVPYIQSSRGMVIYGTKDPQFNNQSTQAIEYLNDIEVYPIQDATHSLEVETVSHSLVIMNEIVDIYQTFLKI